MLLHDWARESLRLLPQQMPGHNLPACNRRRRRPLLHGARRKAPGRRGGVQAVAGSGIDSRWQPPSPAANAALRRFPLHAQPAPVCTAYIVPHQLSSPG